MGYMLVTAVLVVTLGRLGDIYGRVKIYNAGFAIFTITSVVLSPARLFLARGLTHGREAREGTEVITVVRVPLSAAVEMVARGRVTHGPSCVLILKAHLYLSDVA